MYVKYIKRRAKHDDVILNFLRENPSISRDELNRIHKTGQSPISKINKVSLNRRLKGFEKYGVIKHIPDQYFIVEEIKEANRGVIKNCLEVIRNPNENEIVLRERIKQLRGISLEKRVAHLPNVLSTLEDCLENPKIINNEETFNELNHTLENILRLEKEHKFIDSNKIIERINEGPYNKIAEIITKTRSFPEKQIINFLLRSGKNEAVDAVFKKMRTDKPRYDQIHEVASALQEIYPTQHNTIDKHIDDLIRNEDKTLQEIGVQIRPYLIQKS